MKFVALMNKNILWRNQIKKQTKSNFPISLELLGIIFLIFFGMAFACKEGDEIDSPQTRNRKDKTTSSRRCSTEAEFQDIIQNKFHLGTFGPSYGEYKDSEIEFHSFKIGEPFRYTNSYPVVDAYPAYPVTTEYTTRHYLNSIKHEMLEYQWTNVKLVCYVDHHGECTCERKDFQKNERRILLDE